MKLTKNRILLLAVVSLAVFGISKIPSKNKMPEGEKAGVDKVYTVQTQKALVKPLQEYLFVNGNIQTNNTISVYPDISGKVKSVKVTLGSNVKRGDLIATVDPSVPGSIYAESPVYAPISGKITAIPLTVGTSVSTTSAIAQIGTVNGLQIKAMVSEKNVAVLKNGLEADISLVAYSGESFKAHVNRVSPIVDEASRTKEIYLLFDSDDERVNAGMYAKIKLYTTLHTDSIVIPYDAVVSIDNKSYVYVALSDGTASLRQVECGVIVDGCVQIIKGLEEGESIVVTGVSALDDGVKIRNVEV